MSPSPSPLTRGAAVAWAVRHPVAARLEEHAGGPTLVDELVPLAPADLEDVTLVEVVGGWERVISWAAARQAEAIAELRRRRCGSDHEFVVDEVAARLCTSRRAGERLVHRATPWPTSLRSTTR